MRRFTNSNLTDGGTNQDFGQVVSKEALSVLMLCAPVFIFTSSSSALLGRPRCGLSI